jgi:hypothetical protein
MPLLQVKEGLSNLLKGGLFMLTNQNIYTLLIILIGAIGLLLYAFYRTNPIFARITFLDGREDIAGPFFSMDSYYTWHDRILRDYRDSISDISILPSYSKEN